ncbi:MAG: hypothetical protein DRQ40_03855 [Gammaproteobacteria bacterium]|nr:MAG: hypothetical protein DRQ40_03855 [Gammaproteobacteria bacterium]
MKKNLKLVKLIDKYGRKKLATDTGISKIMIDFVCTNRRQFGIVPDNKGVSAADRVAKALNTDRATVRPDIWG